MSEGEIIGYRVLSPHQVKTESLGQGNLNIGKNGKTWVTSMIGTGLPKDQAKKIADQLNQQKPPIERLLHPAKVVEDRV